MGGNTALWTKLRNVLLGASAGAAVCGLLLLLFAALLTAMRTIPQALLLPLSVFAAVVGAFAAGLCSGILSGHNGWLYGLTDALLLFVILFVCDRVLIGDELTAIVLIKLGSMLLFGMLGGVIGVNRRLRY